jgi:hypothetical protein
MYTVHVIGGFLNVFFMFTGGFLYGFYGQHFRFRASEEGYCEDFNVSKYFIEENKKVTNKISKTVVRCIKSSKTISAHMMDFIVQPHFKLLPVSLGCRWKFFLNGHRLS